MKILDQQPETIDFHMADGVFIKSIVVQKAETYLPQHSHGYDHTSFIATGAVHVWEDDLSKGVVTAPGGILIRAGVKHLFQTLEDNTTILCIHNLHGEEAVKVLAEHQLTGEF